MSAWMIFAFGKYLPAFLLRVAQHCPSFSTKARMLNLDFCKPSANPPAPANNSTESNRFTRGRADQKEVINYYFGDEMQILEKVVH